MYSLLFIFTVFNFILGIFSAQKESHTTLPIHFKNVSTTCGEVLTSPEGVIDYKSTSLHDFDERCVWTIRAPLTRNYEFTVSYVGFTANATGINILRLVGRPSSYIYPNNSKIQTTGVYEYEADVAIVTFYSEREEVGNGFILEYKAVGNQTEEISAESQDIITSSPVVFQDKSFVANELSTFLFSPGFTQDYGTEKIGTYNRTGVYDPAADCLCCLRARFYNFFTDGASGGYPAEWREDRGKICLEDEKYRIARPDMLLFVFQSNYSSNGTTLQLEFKRDYSAGKF